MSGDAQWQFITFGLIVTGQAEEAYLPLLFRSLTKGGNCYFKTIRRISQRSPIESQKRQLKMIGTGKSIPDRDETEIGLPARRFLAGANTFVLLVDDLERERVAIYKAVFDRYRTALDTMLGDQDFRASVHFLVNMLEAYYFADSQAVNAVLKTDLTDYENDVESIPHPKRELKGLAQGFDPVAHGGQILTCLDLRQVLSRPDTCASLRTMVAWCVTAMNQPLTAEYCLSNGRFCDITRPQMDRLGEKGSTIAPV